MFARGSQLGVVLLLLASVVVVVWLNSDHFQALAQGAAERLVEAQTGEELSITRVQVRYFPPGLEVQGLNLFHAATGETIASVDKAVVPITVGWTGARVGVISLRRPVIHLHLDEDGKLREFRQRRQGNGPSRPLQRLFFDGLAITDGVVRLDHPKRSVALTGFDVTQTAGRFHTLAGEITLKEGSRAESATFRWDRVRIGPTELSVPDLALHFAPFDLTGSVSHTLNGPLQADLQVLTRLDEIGWLEAPRALHGVLHADVEVRGTPTAPRAHVNLAGRGLGLDLPGMKVPVIHYRFHDLTIAAELSRDRVVVEDLTAEWGGGTLRATALIDPVTRSLIDARVVGDSLSLRELLVQFDAAPTPWIGMSTDAEVRLTGSLSPLRLTGPFDLAVADLTVKNGPVDRPFTTMLAIPSAWARGQLLLEANHIELDATELAGPGTRGRVKVDIGFLSHGPLDLQADLQADLSDFQPLGGVQLGGRGPIRGRIHGPFNGLTVEAQGTVDQFSVLGIPFAERLDVPVIRSDLKRLELEEAVATVGKTTYFGDFAFDFQRPMSLTTDVSMRDGRVEDILGVFLDLPGVEGTMSGQLTLDGPVMDMDGLADFVFTDVSLWGERFERGSAKGAMDKGIFTLDDLRLLRHGRREGLMLRGTVERKWALNMDLLADGFDLATLDHLLDRGLPLTGGLSAQARIDNTLFAPEPHGTLRARDVRYAGSALGESRLDFHTRDGRTTLDGRFVDGAIRSQGTLGLWGDRSLAVQSTLTDFPAHLFYPTGADGSPIEAVGSGVLNLQADLAIAEQPVRLQGELTDVKVAWGGHVLRNKSPWAYSQVGKAFTLDNFDLQGGRIDGAQGRTDVSLTATGGDALLLDGRGELDLDLLRAVVPGLTRAEGISKVRLAVEGARPDVRAVVDLEVDAELLRYEAVPAAFEDVTATLQLTPDRFDVTALKGSLGGGSFTGGGTIDAKNWTPSRYDLTMDVDNAQIQWVDSLPPAIGDATLTFDGPSNALLLAGKVDVEQMSFSDRIDWEDWVVEYRSQVMVGQTSSTTDEPALFGLDLHIEADRTVRLRNNVADGLASADLRIIGDTNRPGLVGRVDVENAVVVLQDREFRVDRGQIRYTDPWSWDPDIDFDLVTDIESRSQRYRVNYEIYGPFSDWRTTTRSDPGLPQSDVNALLWFGVTTDDLEQSGELPTAVAQGVADLLLTDLFSSTQASELGEVPDLLFDRIDVATGVNGRGEYSAEPRLVVSKRLQDLSDLDLTWEFNLGRPEDNYLRLERRVGSVWSLAGWYATLQRDRVLPIGGAYGLDVTARWEFD